MADVGRPLAELANRFRFNDKFLEGLLDGFEEEDWEFRPAGNLNSTTWIVGHLTATRRSIRRTLGDEIEKARWEECFDMGKSPDDADDAPSGLALAEDFLACGQAVHRLLTELTEEEAEREWGHAFPYGSDTIGGAAHFFFFHETYHLGQIGLIRRLRGKPRFA